MFSYVFCVVTFVAALILVQPIEGETNEGLYTLQEPLCRFVQSAASQTRFEEEAEARLQDGEFFPVTDSDRRSLLRLENRTDRELFESSLTNWLFFEDLARRQQSMIEELLVRCKAKRSGLSMAASVFAQTRRFEARNICWHHACHVEYSTRRSPRRRRNGRYPPTDR